MSKPRLNVAFVTGDTNLNVSLAAALCPRRMSSAVHREAVEEFAEMDGGSPTPNYAEFETATRRYTAIEYGPYEKPRRMLLNAAPCLDGAVLTVFASEGLGVVTREHALLLREAGVRHVAMFVDTSNVVGEPEMVDLTEHQTRALLAEYGFPADDLPVVRGDLLAVARGEDVNARRCLEELRSSLDLLIPLPCRDTSGPFLLSIDGVGQEQGDTTVVTGWVERGQVEVRDELQVWGGGTGFWQVRVSRVPRSKSAKRGGQSGSRISLSLTEALGGGVQGGSGPRVPIRAGQVLAAPGSVHVATWFDADCYLATRREGGRDDSLGHGEKVQILLRSAEAPGVIRLSEGQRELWPGRRFCARVELPADCATMLLSGLRFAFRDEEGLSGYGIVQEVYR
jgi:elongation factor Tu